MTQLQRMQQPANANELLSTKLTPPRLQPSLLLRERLLMRLAEGLDRKLTLLSAPSGFGKTTLASAWLVTRTEPVGWVSLDEGDNDPIRFWRYVITACGTFDPALGRSARATLRASPQPAFESVLTRFINEAAALPQRGILVLDDYHVVTSREIHESLAFLLDHFPATLHLMLISRSEPPLPLARLRVRGELNELHVDDLRFSPAEIQAFFQETLRRPLSTDALARLEARAEGWAAGLRLVALALEGQTDPAAAEGFLASFSGEHRPILEYLPGEVLAHQPEPLQIFLLQTGVLNRLTASLCDAITGRNDSAAVLEQLMRANLFLIPLGNQGDRSWYRYHTLFAEALLHVARQRFGEAGLQALHGKAALWHAAQGFLAEAIEASIAAHAFERAAALIEQLLEQRGFSELQTLRRWAEQLPQDVLHDHPGLCFNYAMALLFTSDRYAPATAALVETPLRAAEEIWRKAQDDRGLGQVFALRSTIAMWQGDWARSFAWAKEALALLPEHEVNWRGVSLLNVSIQDLLAGKIDSVQRMALEARALCEAAQNIHGVSGATLLLAGTFAAQTELDQAEALYRQVLSEAGDAEELLDDRGFAQLGLGTLAFERDDLASAEQHAAQALEFAQRRPEADVHVHASLLLARIQHARGQTEPAQDRLRALAARTHRTSWLREVQAWQARFSLDAGDLAAAQRWRATYVPHTDAVPKTQQEQEALILVRLHIAEGDSEAALKLLERWRRDARAHGRVRSELEILCVQALAHAAQADTQRAHKILVRALTLAQPSGCRRVFLDEGENMAALLQAVIPDLNKRPLATHATLLLKAFAATRSIRTLSVPTVSSPLLEPLSPQEQRVLRLLAAGLSNPEIARELVVSPNTIKTQIQSIYRKLNVNNRDEASEMARQLNLW